MISILPISREKLEELRNSGQSDEELQQVKQYIANGWPDNKQQVDKGARIYFSHRDELSQQDGIFFKGEKVIIPKNLRNEIMK